MQLLRFTMFVLFLVFLSVPAFTLAASAQIAIGIDVPPPPLPVYDQPVIPAPGYIWTPGYWAYDDDYGYYWVPGTWVPAPQAGLLWTPGYWAFADGNYVYYEGYWGPEVGYYGGVDYGYGYTGDGYEGGYWRGNNFFYNRTVNNITNVNITNVYAKPVTAAATANRASYSGGAGGTTARPTQQQLVLAQAHHVPPTALQREHVQMASRDPSLREAENSGRPPIAATARPDAFKGPGIVAATTAGQRPSGQLIPHGKKGPSKPHGMTSQPNAAGEQQPLEKPKTSLRPENPRGQGKPESLPMQHGTKGKPETQRRAVPPYPEAQPHSAMKPRPHPQPRPAMQPHPQGPPHAPMQRRPAAPPHPQGQPHPAGAQGHPAQQHPQDQP